MDPSPADPPKPGLVTLPAEQAGFRLLDLPAELRLIIFSHVSVHTLLDLDGYKKTIHTEINHLLRKRAVFKIARRKEDSGGVPYSKDFRTLKRLNAKPGAKIENVLVYLPFGYGQRKNFDRAFDAFDAAIARLDEVGIKNLSLALLMPNRVTQIDNFGRTIAKILEFLFPHEDSQKLSSCKLILVCHGELHEYAPLESFESFMDSMGQNLKQKCNTDLEIRLPRQSASPHVRQKLFFAAHGMLQYRFSHYCAAVSKFRKVDITYYKKRQDKSKDLLKVSYLPSRITKMILGQFEYNERNGANDGASDGGDWPSDYSDDSDVEG